MKTNLKNKIAAILTAAITVTSFGTMNAFAFVSGYKSATEYTGTVSEYIESPTQNDWYRIDVTEDELPCEFSVRLSVPANCMYNFELSRADLGTRNRPEIISNETLVASTRRRYMNKVLTETGIYYVRVYSQNGTTANLDAYELKITKKISGKKSFSYDASSGVAIAGDWSICADMLGNYMYNKTFYGNTSSRNYKNAYVFITSDMSSDSVGLYEDTYQATPEETALAADYIYSGYKMATPKFVAKTDVIWEFADMLRYVHEYDEPIIIYMAEDDTIPRAQKKYVILKGVKIDTGEIIYYDPVRQEDVVAECESFFSQGIRSTYGYIPYTGTNIVVNDYKSDKQRVYN